MITKTRNPRKHERREGLIAKSRKLESQKKAFDLLLSDFVRFAIGSLRVRDAPGCR